MSGADTFEALLAPILGAAYKTALSMTRNSDDAQDLVQDAAVRAFRAFDSFQPGTNFRAWFFRIMTNVFLNDYRRRQRQPDQLPFEDVPELFLYAQATHQRRGGRASDPVSSVLGKLGAEQIVAAIASLPEEFRVVASLYFVEELSYQEIAEIVDCPVGTVRSRLHRGRKILQKVLWELAVQDGVVTEAAAREAQNRPGE